MIAIASDHGGFALKQQLIKHLQSSNISYRDYGTDTEEAVDYPDYVKPACGDVLNGKAEYAILICGTGIGISMSANRIKGIRAALCSDCFSAKLTRRHNNANVLCLGGRVIGAGLACEIVDIFLSTDFDGGRHQIRIDKIEQLE